MAYAETTTVTVERSRAEIERLLHTHGSQQISKTVRAKQLRTEPAGNPPRNPDRETEPRIRVPIRAAST